MLGLKELGLRVIQGPGPYPLVGQLNILAVYASLLIPRSMLAMKSQNCPLFTFENVVPDS